MTQEELMTLRLPRLQQIAERHGIQWANAHGRGRHLRKPELVELLAPVLEAKTPPPLPQKVYRVVNRATGKEVGRFPSISYAGLFWRGLCQANGSAEAIKMKFRMEETWE
ncbi:MAG: hypothetical protein ACHWZW_22370 [Spirulina sp.]